MTLNDTSNSTDIAVHCRNVDQEHAKLYLTSMGQCSPDLWARYHRRNRPWWKKLLGVK